jgi:hypothetical protein
MFRQRTETQPGPKQSIPSLLEHLLCRIRAITFHGTVMGFVRRSDLIG